MSVCPPRGLQPVPDEEVIDLYGGTQHIPLYQMSDFYGKVLTLLPRAARLVISVWVLAPRPTPLTHRLHPLPVSQGIFGALGLQSWGWRGWRGC